MSLIGSSPLGVQAFFNPILKEFAGTGSTPTFTLDIAPGHKDAVIVTIDGVVQTDYTVAGTTLTFGFNPAAPPSGITYNIAVRYLASRMGTLTPLDNSVTTAMLQDASVTQAKLGSNVVGNGPAFNVGLSGTQSISSGVNTLVQFNTDSGGERFDTGSFFDTSAYKFVPTVAGYYQFNAMLRSSGSAITKGQISLYKNGARFAYGNLLYVPSSSDLFVAGAWLAYSDGNDEFQIYGDFVSTSPGFSSVDTFFSGFLARTA